MLIVMVSGRAGSGKSTFSQYCLEYLKSLDYQAIIVPFARGVKKTAKTCFGWNGNKDSRGRKLLQDIGLIGRAYDKNLWANQAIITIDQVWVTGNTFVFIDDWRFKNEGEVISDKYLDVIKLRLNRPDRYLTLFGTDLFDDLSEVSLPNSGDIYDFKIDNDDDLEKLNNLAKGFIDTILKKEDTDV